MPQCPWETLQKLCRMRAKWERMVIPWLDSMCSVCLALDSFRLSPWCWVDLWFLFQEEFYIESNESRRMAGNSLTCFDLGICFVVVVETTIATYCNGQMIQAQPKAERERILKNQSFCCRFSFVFRIRRFEFDAALTCHALTIEIIEIDLNGARGWNSVAQVCTRGSNQRKEVGAWVYPNGTLADRCLS